MGAVLTAVVGVQAISLDAAAYGRPKGTDYRGAVDRIIAANPESSAVVLMGPNSDWIVQGLQYYGWVRGVDLLVVDGLKLDSFVIDELTTRGTVWGALYPPATGAEPGVDMDAFWHTDLMLVRDIGAAGDGVDQTLRLLEWGSGFEPELQASVALVNLIRGIGALGPEILPTPSVSADESGSPFVDRWTLQPGVTLLTDGSGFELIGRDPQVNAVLTTERIEPDRQYVLSFSHANQPGTDQRVYVVAVADDGTWLQTFPDGGGYLCPTSDVPQRTLMPVQFPTGTRSIILFLRVSGLGQATFRDVSLRPVT